MAGILETLTRLLEAGEDMSGLVASRAADIHAAADRAVRARDRRRRHAAADEWDRAAEEFKGMGL